MFYVFLDVSALTRHIYFEVVHSSQLRAIFPSTVPVAARKRNARPRYQP